MKAEPVMDRQFDQDGITTLSEGVAVIHEHKKEWGVKNEIVSLGNHTF